MLLNDVNRGMYCLGNTFNCFLRVMFLYVALLRVRQLHAVYCNLLYLKCKMIRLHIKYHMHKVSIIIPTKNSGKTIRKCLKSVRDQSYPNIEIVVVDNFSLDHTLKIAQKYADYVFSAAPERSAQRNYGVHKCTGEYVMIVDSDMYLSLNVIKECVEALKKDIIGIYI